MLSLWWIFSIALWISATSAWPWPPSIHNVLGANIVARQATDSASSSISPTVASSIALDTNSASSPSPSGSAKSASGKATATPTGSYTTSHSTVPTSIDPRLPAGGIQMLNPSTGLAFTTYYKVGQHVSLAWNYTNVIASPTAVDVIVSCTANSATYTLASNLTINSTGSVVWDTAPDASGTNPLLTETYTLVIFDAAGAATAAPEAGKLAPYQFRFGMYVPQQYTPLADFVCATCSGAISDMERQTFKFLFGMAFITVASFTWFAGGFLAYL